jgi:hypothetical protein
VKGSVSLDEALTKVEELKQQAHPHTQNWHDCVQRHRILWRVWRMKTSAWMRAKAILSQCEEDERRVL